MKRRSSPLRRDGPRSEARSEAIGGALARRAARRVEIRVYDSRGHARAIDPEGEQGEAMLAAARDMLDVAPRRPAG